MRARRTPFALVALVCVAAVAAQGARADDPIYEARAGWSLMQPSGFVADAETLERGGISLLSFSSAGYEPGDLIPSGGAEIAVREYPAEISEVTQVTSDSAEGTGITISAGPPATMQCTQAISDSVSYVVREVSNRVNGRLFIGRLRYRVGDANSAAYRNALDATMASIAVL